MNEDFRQSAEYTAKLAEIRQKMGLDPNPEATPADPSTSPRDKLIARMKEKLASKKPCHHHRSITLG